MCSINPKSTGRGMYSTPPPPLCKSILRHPKKLKLTGLIAYIMLYKMCKFESSTIINVIMMSLPETMAESQCPDNQGI